MTTVSQTSLAIPAGWLNAALYLSDVNRYVSLTPEDWQYLQDWMLNTPFDNGNFIAGEAALALIRDHAPPAIRQEIVESLQHSSLLDRLKALLPEVLAGVTAANSRMT